MGLLKALGATRRQIIALFLTEALFLAALGGIVGLALGYGAVAGLRAFYDTLDFVPPVWAAPVLVLIGGFSLRWILVAAGQAVSFAALP